MDECKETPCLLTAENISKTYGECAALQNVTFSVPKGGIHGILGASGSGKSVLMDILSGSISADGGKVFLSGVPIGIAEKAVKAKIGYMPQRFPFFPNMTVEETLDFVGDARGVSEERRYRQIKEALDLVGLPEREKRLLKHLTGEEKQRVSLAAACLGNPDILLLDEPIPKGDPNKREEFFGILRMLGKIKTVLLATSDFDVAKTLCGDVAILSDGKILVQGDFAELDAKLRQNEEASSLAELYRILEAASSRTARMFSENDDSKTDKRKNRKKGVRT